MISLKESFKNYVIAEVLAVGEVVKIYYKYFKM